MEQLTITFKPGKQTYLSLPLNARINVKSWDRSLDLIFNVISNPKPMLGEIDRPKFTCKHGFYYNRANYQSIKPQQKFRVQWYKKREIRDHDRRLIGFSDEDIKLVSTNCAETYEEAKRFRDMLLDFNDVSLLPVEPTIVFDRNAKGLGI